MKTISLKKFYQVVFFLCIAVPFLNVYELTFGVWFFAVLISFVNKYSLTIIQYLSCFLTILIIAFVSSFFNDEGNYNFFRDLAYLLKPIIGLLLGYQLMKKFPKSFFSTVVYSGVLIAIGHLIIVFITFLRFQTISVNLLREYCGYFSDYEVYALIILMFHKKFEANITKKYYVLGISILSLSIFLYLSRTNFIQFIILYLAMKGFFIINKRALMVMGTTTVLLVASYIAIYNSNPSRSGKGIEAFLYKVKNAPIEAFKTKVNTDDWRDFNDNYRSFENIITVRQVSNGGITDILFGKGLGATINIGREIRTNDGTYVQYIPILHNGFATVFLKSGLVGVIILIITLWMLARNKRSSIPIVQNINLLLVGTSLFLIVSNWVFMGLYLKMDSKSILIGLLICYREILIKKTIQQENAYNEL
ncbi:hypothetical protein [Flavobacterium sp.]|uniref:hypothetical protein n=1 Tax=Flavobacterium sp. TaxID=239 RepID=UPI002612728D|nr:hypothetical protein [Flavobacterium sp.]MDD3004340.1 hypothetical protein [Flavobacterium sp.]